MAKDDPKPWEKHLEPKRSKVYEISLKIGEKVEKFHLCKNFEAARDNWRSTGVPSIGADELAALKKSGALEMDPDSVKALFAAKRVLGGAVVSAKSLKHQ